MVGMMSVRSFVALALLAALSWSAAKAQGPAYEPRVIIGLYDASPKDSFEASYLYEMAEFPLNHVGLELEYHNVRSGLPDLSKRTDVRGILVWLIDANTVDGEKLADFVETASARGLPVLVTGPLPARGTAGQPAPNDRILAAIGLRNLGGFRPYTYDMKPVHKVAAMVEFERKLPVALPPIDIVQASDPKRVTPYLVLQRGTDAASRTLAVVATDKGGYVAPGYMSYEDKTADWKAWRVDPFAFFREVFRTQTMPIADTSTISGRRIYYSHIDGDGWNSVSEVDAYAKRGAYASEVILDEVVRRFPSLPVTVAPIAADLDPAWMGTKKSQDIARAFFRLPQVEIGTHTYTHPFEWAYFGPGYDARSELHFVPRYAKAKVDPSLKPDPNAPKRRLHFSYDVPRAYGDIPFNIDREVSGSIAYINQFAPPGKKAAVLQWSGDTRAFPAAMAATVAAGVPNINGWGSRFDGDYPSYTNVAPVGRRVGQHIRVYASHANENEYTALWQGRYFGFRYLTLSLKNTETPRRVKPANVYYHMYSGEKPAALTAMLEIMTYVSAQTLAPITTSRYARIGEGFFRVRFAKIGPGQWRIENRGALDTLRYDDAANMHVDYAKSSGVLGHTRTNGSLYVTLDSANRTPVVAIGTGPEPRVAAIILDNARWRVHSGRDAPNGRAFKAEGFGNGEMTWIAPAGAAGRTARLMWRNKGGPEQTASADVDTQGRIAFVLPSEGFNSIDAVLTISDQGAQTQ
jgi:polysaccharide biosynthesis protein PelA